MKEQSVRRISERMAGSVQLSNRRVTATMRERFGLASFPEDAPEARRLPVPSW